jgi:hypothetical protein
VLSERFSEATASLNYKEEAVRALYSSKERFKQIVRKSELPRRADGSIDNIPSHVFFVCPFVCGSISF